MRKPRPRRRRKVRPLWYEDFDFENEALEDWMIGSPSAAPPKE